MVDKTPISASSSTTPTETSSGKGSPFLKSMESDCDPSMKEVAANALNALRSNPRDVSTQPTLEEYRSTLNDTILYFEAVVEAKKSYLSEQGLQDTGLTEKTFTPVEEQVIEFMRSGPELKKNR